MFSTCLSSLTQLVSECPLYGESCRIPRYSATSADSPMGVELSVPTSVFIGQLSGTYGEGAGHCPAGALHSFDQEAAFPPMGSGPLIIHREVVDS